VPTQTTRPSVSVSGHDHQNTQEERGYAAESEGPLVSGVLSQSHSRYDFQGASQQRPGGGEIFQRWDGNGRVGR
jgi:hypothetical protein